MKNILRMFCVYALLFVPFISYSQSDNVQATFKVKGNCGMCKDRIEEALLQAGVQRASWQSNTEEATVVFNPAKLQLNQLHAVVAKAGHDTEKALAPDDVYDNLPGCCLYDRNRSASLMYGKVLAPAAGGAGYEPLPGATVMLAGTTKGTITDKNGLFYLEKGNKNKQSIIVSFVGYNSDTVVVPKNQSALSVVLSESGTTLNEVKVLGTEDAGISKISVMHTEKLDRAELLKAPCCNLSESFETNASVDVSYTDAVTGAKQIRLLGLDGIYVQKMMENMPFLRGLSSAFGMEYVPGSWVNSIDLGKGAGSVVNGYESVTGQINLEMRKPDNMPLFYADQYINNYGRAETNVLTGIKLNNKWSTALYAGGQLFNNQVDRNNDSFMDLPVYKRGSLFNRYKYNAERLMLQFGLAATVEDRTGGQLDGVANDGNSSYAQPWQAQVNTQSLAGFFKTGYTFKNYNHRSLAFISRAEFYQTDGVYGLRAYEGVQKNISATGIYQTIIGTTDHQVRTGMSFMADDYTEQLADSAFGRHEKVLGAFGEYSWFAHDKLTMVTGVRADAHNMFGLLPTGRFHIKYNPAKKSHLRFSLGNAYRSPNPLLDRPGLLASNRVIISQYDYQIERAVNTGVSFVQEFDGRHIFKEANLIIDFYRTQFQNQLIADMETMGQLSFYNLNGTSYANSFQVEYGFEAWEGFNVKMAYKYYDVKATINQQLQTLPLVPQNRLFTTASYQTNSKWFFDATVQFYGTKRLPNHTEQLRQQSPLFYTVSLQVRKQIKKYIEVYIGGENLFDFRQDNPILMANDPYNSKMDASQVWGPIIGRVLFLGARFSLE